MADPARRRAFGQYFTPPWLARQVVADALAGLIREDSPHVGHGSRALQVLDPAAGEGAFLLAAFDVCRAYATRRNLADLNIADLEIAQLNIAGCEIDERVLLECRRQISSRLNQSNVGEPVKTLTLQNSDCWEFTSKDLAETRFRLVHGNAVTGRDWTTPTAASNTPPPISTPDPASNAPVNAAAIDWSAEFPDVAAAGGFDLVVGNPPFVRELGSRQLLAAVSELEWCAGYRQPRMDLSQYFVHRALNLLRPGGVLAFILPEYWLSGSSGRRLRQRLATECTLQQIVVLGKWPIFDGVSGRHLILQVLKTPPMVGAMCIVRHMVESFPAHLESEPVVQTSAESDTFVVHKARMFTPSITKTYTSVWCNRLCKTRRLPVKEVAPADGTTWNVHGGDTDELSSYGASLAPAAQRSHVESHSLTTTQSVFVGLELGSLFDVRQGIAENPPVVTKTMATESQHTDNLPGDCSESRTEDQSVVTLGEGVFVLTTSEVLALELSPIERSLLRPYFVPRNFQPFAPPTQPERWLLYLTERTAPDIAALPNIRQHLQRFKRWLDRRREVQRSRIAWWHLHWPRQERLFIEPRVIGLQMSREPTFAWMTAPSFVGFSCHVIVPANPGNSDELDSTDPNAAHAMPVSLAALTGLLNSEFAAGWFERNAKKRGVRWDISGGVLRRFPLPPLDREFNARLTQLVETLQLQLSPPPNSAENACKTPTMASLQEHIVPTSELVESTPNVIGGPPSSGQSTQVQARPNGMVNSLKLAPELRSEISQAVNAWYAEGAKTDIR